MEVFVDGERIFDKKGEGNIYPDLARVRKMREVIAETIANAVPVPADNQPVAFWATPTWGCSEHLGNNSPFS